MESLSQRSQTVRKTKFTDEQIVAILAEQAQGMATSDVCSRHGVSFAKILQVEGEF
tara:strand:- start:370 stop:537 length:168 start_codon:yes stop_codon:yes gene_type:complete